MRLLAPPGILAAFLALSASASGIGLEECKTLAVRNSRLLASYQSLIASAAAAYRKDKSALFPHLSGSYEPEYLQYGGDSEYTQGFQHKLGLELSFDLQKLLADYPQLSGLELEKGEVLKSIAEGEILKSLVQEYGDLSVFLKKKQDYRAAQSYITEHIRNIQALQDQGLDVRLDANRAQSQLRSLALSVSANDAEIAKALIALNLMMDTNYYEADFGAQDAPAPPAPETEAAAPEGRAEGSALAGLENSVLPEMLQLAPSRLDELEVKIAREKYRQSRFYYIPSLQAGFEHNPHVIDPNTEKYRTYLAFSLDLFDFGQRARESEELKCSYESQQRVFEDNQRLRGVRIRQLISGLRHLQTAYADAGANITCAENAMGIARDYYRQGKIKETDLLMTFDDYLKAKDQAYDLWRDYISQRAELDSITARVDK